MREPDINSLGIVRKSRRQSIAPCERRILSYLEVLRDLKRKEPEEYWKRMGQFGLSDYWFYLRVVLNYSFPDPWDHGEEQVHFFMEHLNEPKLFLVPRGGMKTSLITAPILPWLIAKDPTLRGIITNVREEKAAEFARMAANIILTPKYQACYPWVRQSQKWGEAGYYVETDSDDSYAGRTDPSIKSYGVGGNITGSHVGAMAHDDLINEKTANSAVELEKAESFFTESLNCLDPGGFLCVAATRWRYNDLYGKLVSGDITGGGGQRFVVFKRGAERVVLGENNEPVVEIFNPCRTYVDFRGTQKQVGFTPEFLDGQKKNLGSSQYSALFMNEPVSDEDRIFAIDTIKEFYHPGFDTGPVSKIAIEIESQAASFWDAWFNYMRDHNKLIPSTRVVQPRDKGKHERIRAIIQPIVESGRFNVAKHLFVTSSPLGQEMREFDKGSDDVLDALCLAIENARKHNEKYNPWPSIGVDPAFTNERQSDYSAIVVGCWFYDEWYTLDVHRFKTAKTDILCGQIARMYDKWNRRIPMPDGKEAGLGRFVSSGNERPKRGPSLKVNWGQGVYDRGHANEETEN